MSFEHLLNDLEELKKAQAPAFDEGDKKIQEAAETSNGDELDDEDEDEKKNKAEEDDGEEDEKGEMTKSFTAVIDGEEQEVIDGTEMIKSLQAQVSSASAALEAIKGERATENEHLAKSMSLVADMLKEQGALVKSLQAQVEKLSNEGRGRKSVTQPTVDMTKSLSASEPLNAGSFMLKANAAFDAGRLTGKELTVCDVAVRMGCEVDQSIIKKIVG